jgi:hypothetical protein
MDSDTLQELRTHVRSEIAEAKSNPLKEAVLLLSKGEIDYIFWVCDRLQCTPLASHVSVTIYAEAVRQSRVTKTSGW